jgi:hypothetical protein
VTATDFALPVTSAMTMVTVPTMTATRMVTTSMAAPMMVVTTTMATTTMVMMTLMAAPTTMVTTSMAAPMTPTVAPLTFGDFHDIDIPRENPKHDEYASNLAGSMETYAASLAAKTNKVAQKAVHVSIQFNSDRVRGMLHNQALQNEN